MSLTSCGLSILYYGYRDYDSALKELELARQTLPNNPEILELTGYILRRRGKSEDGLQSIQRALELDPRNFYTLQQIAIELLLPSGDTKNKSGCSIARSWSNLMISRPG